MRKHIFSVLIFSLSLLLAAWTLSGAGPALAAPLELTDRGHPALMPATEEGLFQPNEVVIRRELCRLLAPMLTGLPRGDVDYTDVGPEDEEYDAIAALSLAGVLPDEEGSAFRPNRLVKREELAKLLSRLADCLSGDAASRARTLSVSVASGSIAEGTYVRRSELAVVLERLAGREPDGERLLLDGLVPRDVSLDEPHWEYMADASVQGEIPVPAGGVHRAAGWLYAAWDDGTMVIDRDYGVWTFGLDGRYTTGSAELDGYLLEALEASGANDLQGQEALAAVYLYVKQNFEYLVRPEDAETVEVGLTGWEYERAVRFFRYGGGTCYGFAAAFGLLARALGETAYIVSATVNEFHGPHGFVVIPEDGVDRIYDVELENTRPERHGDLELFHLLNHEIYHYWYEPDWGEP